MAQAIATTPLANPLLTEVRGASLYDVTDTTSRGSSKSIPTAYIVNNVCDAPAGIKFGSSVTILQRSAGCEVITAGTMSIKGFVPLNAVAADIDQLLLQIVGDIKTAVVAL